MIASIEYRRLLLRGLWWDAEDASETLEETLKAACRANLTSTSSGRVLIGTSGNGASVSYAVPSSTLTAGSIALACADLYSRYEAALAELVADGDATPTDAEIFTRMMALLISSNEGATDFSQLRDRAFA